MERKLLKNTAPQTFVKVKAYFISCFTLDKYLIQAMNITPCKFLTNEKCKKFYYKANLTTKSMLYMLQSNFE